RRVELAAGSVERADVYAGQRGRTTALEVDGMGGAVGQHLLARPAVHPQGDLVAHRARRQEHRRLLAEDLGDHLLQEVHGGILVLLLVAHLRLAHEAAHLGRWTGHGVAVQIDVDRARGGDGQSIAYCARGPSTPRPTPWSSAPALAVSPLRWPSAAPAGQIINRHVDYQIWCWYVDR